MPATQKMRLAAGATSVLTLILGLFLVVLNLLGPAFNPAILGFQLLPLILTLHGQFRYQPRAFQWLCFIIMFFFVQGVLLMFTADWLLAGSLETLLCLLIFAFAIIFIRAQRQSS